MAKFAEALDRKAEEIKRPPNPPVGEYIFTISKMAEHAQLNDEWSKVTHHCAIVSATDTVDPDDLAEFGNVAGQYVKKEFMFNEKEDGDIDYERALADLKEFYERCGIDIDSGSLKTWMADCVNAQFMGELKHRPDKNEPDTIYTEIGRTAAA